MRKMIYAIACLSVIISPASAETRLTLTPQPAEGASIRYTQGVASIDVRKEHGAVMLTPLGLDHNRLTFGVSVMNLGPGQDNFGVENIRAAVLSQNVVVLTRARLEQLARRRAFWTTFAVAMLAGAAAASAASARDNYTATTITPHGTYHTFITAPSAGGQVVAAATIAGGALTINNIQQQLDATRAALADEIVQTTTIDPNDSYGGRFVLDELHGPAGHWPQDVQITVHFNGEDFPFTFHVERAH